MDLITQRIFRDSNIFLYSCTHTGNSLRSKKGWAKLVDMVNSSYDGLPENHNFCVDHGDAVEAITIDDRRFDGLTTTGCIDDQFDEAVLDRKPIKDKIICMLDSNHLRSLWRHYGNGAEYPTIKLCKRLGIKFGTYSCRIRYEDHKGNLLFKQYATHGKKSITSTADDPIRRAANLKLILKRHLKRKSGDCLLMSKAHVHQLFYAAPEYELFITGDEKRLYSEHRSNKPNDNWIHPDHRWYVCPGSFLTLFGKLGHSGYAEVAEYDPVENGFAICRVRNGDIAGIDLITID